MSRKVAKWLVTVLQGRKDERRELEVVQRSELKARAGNRDFLAHLERVRREWNTTRELIHDARDETGAVSRLVVENDGG